MPHISIYYDNELTLSRAFNHLYNRKSRHIGLKNSYMRHLVTKRVITIDFRSCQNLANPLSKGLVRDIVLKTSIVMRLKPSSSYH